jgi:hypothetical protein
VISEAHSLPASSTATGIKVAPSNRLVWRRSYLPAPRVCQRDDIHGHAAEHMKLWLAKEQMASHGSTELA